MAPMSAHKTVVNAEWDTSRFNRHRFMRQVCHKLQKEEMLHIVLYRCYLVVRAIDRDLNGAMGSNNRSEVMQYVNSRTFILRWKIVWPFTRRSASRMSVDRTSALFKQRNMCRRLCGFLLPSPADDNKPVERYAGWLIVESELTERVLQFYCVQWAAKICNKIVKVYQTTNNTYLTCEKNTWNIRLLVKQNC